MRIQRSLPVQRRTARLRMPRPRWFISALSALAAFGAAVVALAPVASATYLPPNPAGPPAILSPGVPPVITVPHLTVGLVAVVAASVVLLSIATTLITLSLIQRRGRLSPAVGAGQSGALAGPAGPGQPAGPGDILLSHPYQGRRPW